MENIQNKPLVLGDDVTFGLGEITLFTSPGTFPITPASRISIFAEVTKRHC